MDADDERLSRRGPELQNAKGGDEYREIGRKSAGAFEKVNLTRF
jgi:hypothetical protein